MFAHVLAAPFLDEVAARDLTRGRAFLSWDPWEGSHDLPRSGCGGRSPPPPTRSAGLEAGRPRRRAPGPRAREGSRSRPARQSAPGKPGRARTGGGTPRARRGSRDGPPRRELATAATASRRETLVWVRPPALMMRPAATPRACWIRSMSAPSWFDWKVSTARPSSAPRALRSRSISAQRGAAVDVAARACRAGSGSGRGRPAPPGAAGRSALRWSQLGLNLRGQ